MRSCKTALFFCLLFLPLSSYGFYIIGRDPLWSAVEMSKQDTTCLTSLTNVFFQKIEGETFEILDVDSLQLFEGLENGSYDGILSTINPTLEMRQRYDFSLPIIPLGPVLILPKTNPAHHLYELHDKIIGINQFDNSILIVQKYPTLIPRAYENMRVALDDLAQGHIDGVLIDVLDANRLISSIYSHLFHIATPPLNNKAVRLITLKEKNLIIPLINTALRKKFFTQCQ